jgi:hypothetical protein
MPAWSLDAEGEKGCEEPLASSRRTQGDQVVEIYEAALCFEA